MAKNNQPNKLITEKSPYLLQHAHNPVHWYPWGEEAFERARTERKPVLVSIGYSTCHWCHVMNRESFEDPKIAAFLNEHFVAIKVDREERPDIDAIYMEVCQIMTGHGGWPLNVFLTPEQEPFFAGTYFPKEPMPNMPSFLEVLKQLSDRYHSHPEEISQIGAKMREVLQEEITEGVLSEEVIHRGFQALRQQFDPVHGGFREAPKFPMPHVLMYLFRYYHFMGEETALKMAVKTLDQMARGGMYDHIGFGFSRYSVDETWLVPHFEKMLYDNALLAITYTEAFQITKEDRFRQVAEEVLTYVLRDMQDEGGAFYSGEDADSEGVEGKFYVWTKEEVMDVLGPEDGALFCEVYDITGRGNFEGKNIPNLLKETPESFAARNGLDVEKVKEILRRAKKQLFHHRKKRVPPHKDDKILTSWNGLMIVALAKAARAFGERTYEDEAKRAFAFLENNLVVDGRLMVRFRDGDVLQKGFIDEYANMLWAALELYETTFAVTYVTKAKHYADEMIRLFWDAEKGGFFFYGSDSEPLLVRPKETFDNAMPSGNSVASLQLLRLARFTGEVSYEEKTRKMWNVFHQSICDYPSGHTYMLQSLLLAYSGMKEVVILAGDDETAPSLQEELAHQFYPEVTALFHHEKEKLQRVAPFIAPFKKKDEKTTVYVCKNFQCKAPVTEKEKALRLLRE
ncbi:thioredoxin domain-containing protein [Aliibacillus thermotolerans]|uniref:Thioredoxin domain-containing protein n=1 Tax=Aliibacillus thermotolerans TaxID=1834418 RepID=A0ABW0U4N4_9BACI|nr:thioredoxin domain-containing protein [Aliibacillus thermotolerans]MDA3130870.1 DUF255 domain-containing protein [Aliibacillus thermotolerans]